jgi:RNA recognition motif-containing protein
MKKLYVGNLSFSVTEENLRTEFAKLEIHTD